MIIELTPEEEQRLLKGEGIVKQLVVSEGSDGSVTRINIRIVGDYARRVRKRASAARFSQKAQEESLKKLGVKEGRTRKPWMPEDEQEFLERRARGETYGQIADTMNRSYKSVRGMGDRIRARARE